MWQDSTTDAFGRGVTDYTPGTLTVTNGATVNPLYSHVRGTDLYRHYVAVNSDNTYSFHRFRFGIQQYTQYYKNDQMVALTIDAAYVGDTAALGKMDVLGMVVNNEPGWDEDKIGRSPIDSGYRLSYTVTENGTYTAYAALKIGGSELVNNTNGVSVTLGGNTP